MDQGERLKRPRARSFAWLTCAVAVLGTAPGALHGQGVFNGRKGETSARIPRLDATIVVDGALDETAWRQAAVLTGFSSYLPIDNRAADDSTEVAIWYTPTDVYFGIRAFESHGPVHATLAARDRTDSDDNVQLLLDPFNDRRRAFVFGVNPLGVQTDGTRTDASTSPQPRGTTFGGTPPASIDLNPDFQWESRGRLIEGGYEVEVRVPLKSIRFQGTDAQTWSFQVLRFVQHSGYQQTWTAARRGSAAFLSQSGSLTGIAGLRRDMVVELNPEFTASRTSLGNGSAYHSDATSAFGGNVRWRLLPNLTVNGTVRPDFSQVEADAAQIPGDTRFSLFFPEKRPFFVDGSEQFDSPNNLIYTRRIVQPDAAVKLSGKFGRSNVALISAIDDRRASSNGRDHPLYNLVRLRRDIFRASTLGVTLTDRTAGADYNRVASTDTRLVWGGVYALTAQGSLSSTRSAGTTHTSPQWDVSHTRSGFRYGYLYSFSGFDPHFQALSGFVPRNDFVRAQAYNRVSFYGKPGSFIESWLFRQGADALWSWDGFRDGKSVQETKLQGENVFNLRGGWIVSLTPVSEGFRFDPRSYAHYRTLRPAPGSGNPPPDTLSFLVNDRVATAEVLARVTTPQYRLFSGRFSSIIGRDVDFFEAAPAHRTDLTADIDLRPSAKLRLTTSYLYSVYTRWRDNTTLSRASVPRIKVEYQVSRPLFLRFVGQYDSRTRDALRDPRTDLPIVTVRNGVISPAMEVTTHDLRVDWLVSFVPNPGTVVFAGYGASLTEPDAFRFHDMQRVRDGFFVKLSYLFRR
ncbi:MAG: hypothetical protein MNPFHGCM_02659 [Gemmatimonadaceae bacterium]|nr:hypothetical protein [Gemmatimonadaceae bacterium]